MNSVIVAHPRFDGIWPLVAEHLEQLWREQAEVTLIRLPPDDTRPLGAVLTAPESVRRLITLEVPITSHCLASLANLEEAAFMQAYDAAELGEDHQTLLARGVRLYAHSSEGFWGQSVAEFALALTLCGLRRIPQTHRAMIESHAPWDYEPRHEGNLVARGHQFGDDPRFVNGTIAGKRVRIVGAGNIGSRYAGFTATMGAEVAMWDPYASEPCFHRAGARREHHLEHLVSDAEIFAPMLPLTETTEGLMHAGLIDALPTGCLVILATRAGICDMAALRRRVLAGELALAADVFDIEPLPLDDPLLGRDNVVHTPHNAGRTRQANERWAEMLVDQFLPA